MYKKQKTFNEDVFGGYNSVDVVKETEEGLSFIAEFGNWENESSHFYADLFVDYMNELESNK